MTVYNYHTFMDDRRYIDKYVVSAGIIGPDYGANERKEQYHTFLRRLFVKTGASFMRGGLPNNYYIVRCAEHELPEELDVLFDEYLSHLSIVHTTQLPAEFENILNELPVHEWRRMENGFVFIDIWKSWSGGNHREYRDICDRLGFKCMWEIG